VADSVVVGACVAEVVEVAATAEVAVGVGVP
jgi:hypothetical protein